MGYSHVSECSQDGERHVCRGNFPFAKQGPGFAVGVIEAGAAIAFAAEEEAGTVEDVREREDEPGVLGEDVGGDEIDFGELVGDGASVDAPVGVDAVQAIEELGGAFDLDAGEFGHGVGLMGVDDEIVAFAVAVGFGDGEAEGGGFEGEGEFGEFSAALGGEFAVKGRGGVERSRFFWARAFWDRAGARR